MREDIQKLVDNIGKVIIGKEKVIEKIIICLLCSGHILIEDIPGVGKTTMVKALSKSLDLTFKRLQFTPDLLPSDVTGISVYNQRTGEFEFRMGPIHTNILLADEINRTSPKTQSSLLESMEEGQITVDGSTYQLPKPFMVLATQNPIEYEGTFPLPEAQVDRFMMKITVGYPDRYSEKQILRRFKHDNPIEQLTPVLNVEQILKLKKDVQNVYMDESIEDYILDIVALTRNHEHIRLGVSPRGVLALFKAAQGCAFVNERSYVVPDDVKELVIPVLSHRIMLRPEAKIKGISENNVLNSILRSVKVPVVKSNG